jgi:hypothetical protein
MERVDPQRPPLTAAHPLPDLGLEDPGLQEAVCAAVRAMVEAVPEHQWSSYYQVLQPLIASLDGFHERLALLHTLGHLEPSDVMGIGRAITVWLQDVGPFPPGARLGVLQTAVQIFAAIPGSERLSVAHAARLQNLRLLLHERPLVLMLLYEVPKQDRLKNALLSAQLCREALDVEGLRAVIDAFKAVAAPKRMEVAEAVKQFRVHGSPGAMIAQMLTATASLASYALPDFVALMLRVRDVMQRRQTDALITCTAQVCEVLAALDRSLQLDLVALMPRLLDVSAGHEKLSAWMKCLIKRPKGSWQMCLSRFAWLYKIRENVDFPARQWQPFVDEVLTMKDHRYETYVQTFDQMDHPKRSGEDRAALLFALLRLEQRDVPIR